MGVTGNAPALGAAAAPLGAAALGVMFDLPRRARLFPPGVRIMPWQRPSRQAPGPRFFFFSSFPPIPNPNTNTNTATVWVGPRALGARAARRVRSVDTLFWAGLCGREPPCAALVCSRRSCLQNQPGEFPNLILPRTLQRHGSEKPYFPGRRSARGPHIVARRFCIPQRLVMAHSDICADKLTCFVALFLHVFTARPPARLR